MILEGRVAVNGRIVRSLGNKVEPDKDRIVVDGKAIRIPEVRRYMMIHKPSGVLTTVTDPFNRPTIIDLVQHIVRDEDGKNQRLFPIGRLDLDSEGLLLLTDDGELTNRVTHPSIELDKEYRVLVRGKVTDEGLQQCRDGVMIEGQMTSPARVELIGSGGTETTWIRFIIHEGRKRQVRRMCEAVGLTAVRLVRVRIGPVLLGNLRPGHYRDLTPSEVSRLRQAVGLPDAQQNPEGTSNEETEDNRDRRTERGG